MKISQSLTKKLAAGFGILAAAWIAGCALIYSEMCKPPEQFARFMTKIPAPVAFLAFPFETLWTHARGGTMLIGDAAGDFALEKIDKSGTIRLSETECTAAGRFDFWKLYLTAVPAGGSRPQQALRAVQGSRCLSGRIHHRSASE